MGNTGVPRPEEQKDVRWGAWLVRNKNQEASERKVDWRPESILKRQQLSALRVEEAGGRRREKNLQGSYLDRSAVEKPLHSGPVRGFLLTVWKKDLVIF